MKTSFNNKSVWLNYSHLYYFMTVAAEGSIAGAARKLMIGEPALSIQLKQFEEKIDVKLFERSHKKLTLTENGKAALAYAREIFKLGNEMLETLYDKPTSERPHLQVGALDTIPKHLTARLVEAAFKHQNCTVSIFEGKGDELIRELTQHRIDLLVTNKNNLGNSLQVYTRKIARLPLLMVGSEKFKHLRKNFPKSITGSPFILPTEESQVRFEIEHYCKLHGISPDFVAETQDVMVQKLLALKGLGMIAVPGFAAREYLLKKELFIIGKMEGVYEELFLTTASRKIANPVATHLMKNFTLNE